MKYLTILVLGILAGTMFCMGAKMIEIGSQGNLAVIESQVKLEATVDRLQAELDTRCDGSHSRMESWIRWYVMRRSGRREVELMEANYER